MQNEFKQITLDIRIVASFWRLLKKDWKHLGCYIKNKNFDSNIAHEATTSKIKATFAKWIDDTPYVLTILPSDKYNINPRDIVRGIISTRFGWNQDYVDSMYTAWDQFRRDAITELIIMTYDKINSLSNNIYLSAAVKANLVDAK